MKVIESKEDFDEVVKTMGKVVVVEFGAAWCGPCRMITPFFTRLEDELGEAVLFAKVDVDEVDVEDLELGEECEITCMPTFIVYKDGAKVAELKGANKERLDEVVKHELVKHELVKQSEQK